jgi:predicted phage-related endonuclease
VQPAATFRSQQFPYMIANLDGLADERVVEVKNVRTAEGWGEPGSDDVPLVYLLQVQHYMVVTGKPVADVAVLIGGSDFRIYEVPADPELQTMLVSGESELWQHVTRREPPLPVSVEDARRRWGAVSVRGGVTAGPQELEAVAVLRESLLRAEELKARIDAAKLTIMLRLGEGGDTLVDASGQPLVTWKLARASERLDAELLAQEHPELFHSYMRPGKPSRRFLMKDSHG